MAEKTKLKQEKERTTITKDESVKRPTENIAKTETIKVEEKTEIISNVCVCLLICEYLESGQGCR